MQQVAAVDDSRHRAVANLAYSLPVGITIWTVLLLIGCSPERSSPNAQGATAPPRKAITAKASSVSRRTSHHDAWVSGLAGPGWPPEPRACTKTYEDSTITWRHTTKYDEQGRFVSRASLSIESGVEGSKETSTCAYEPRAMTCINADRTGSTCRYALDDIGRIVSAKCSWPGQKSQEEPKTIAYDIRGQELRSVETRLYDEEGRLAELQRVPLTAKLSVALGMPEIARKGRETRRYSYDVRGRRTAEVIWHQGRVVETQSFAWDAKDRLIASVDSSGPRRQVETYTYDALGRLISTSLVEVSGAIPSTLVFEGRSTYTYDCWGDRDPGLVDCHRAGDGPPCP